METALKVCGVKERRRKIKLLSCSFRRLGMCFRNNVRESAFKFLQFTTYNIISRYFPPHKEMMLFPFSFNFISYIKCCVYGWWRQFDAFFCYIVVYLLIFSLLHCCEIGEEAYPCKIEVPFHWGNWPWRKFSFKYFLLCQMSSLFLCVIMWFFVKGMSHFIIFNKVYFS